MLIEMPQEKRKSKYVKKRSFNVCSDRKKYLEIIIRLKRKVNLKVSFGIIRELSGLYKSNPLKSVELDKLCLTELCLSRTLLKPRPGEH